jgi:hypothetical protein
MESRRDEGSSAEAAQNQHKNNGRGSEPRPKPLLLLAGSTGLEPATSGLTVSDSCSSYSHAPTIFGLGLILLCHEPSAKAQLAGVLRHSGPKLEHAEQPGIMRGSRFCDTVVLNGMSWIVKPGGPVIGTARR